MEASARSIRRAKREREILAAVLRLVRRHGTGISTAQISTEASCSKETLYAWFGDRQGIMQALVDAQGQSMGEALARTFAKADGEFTNRLRTYCLALIDIVTGEAVLAVNRLAMADSCTEGAVLGQSVLANWHDQIERPFKALLEKGREEGQLAFDDSQIAFEILMGLLMGDRQRRLLLGEGSRPSIAEMERRVDICLQQFFKLYGR